MERRLSARCAVAVLAAAVALALPACSRPTDPGAGGLACGASPTAAQRQDTTVSLSSGGTTRSYLRQVPASYDASRPLPLVIDLHGFSQSGRAQESLSGLGAQGKQLGYVTVSPDGLGSPPYWDTQETSPDTAFIGDLITAVTSQVCIDKGRVYVAGMSNGAFFTASVACRYADRIAAAAGVGGLRRPAWCAPSRPVPVLAFHGTADTFVKYDGGIGAAAAVLPAPDGSGRTLGQVGAGGDERFVPATFDQSATSVVEAWARGNGCTLPLQATKVASDVDLLSATCPVGTSAALYRITGGGHTWPGHTSGLGSGLFGKTTRSIDATKLIWEHFARYSINPPA